ncbi:MAG TPA: hypothetical protein VKA60_17170 [Blastocatellia bacterium]|nr:hypothetical protein [Blastocatellia bacterium]
MPQKSTHQLLDELDEAKRDFGAAGGRVAGLLAEIGSRDFDDPEALVRFHEALLFIRAYPQDEAALAAADRLLDGFAERVAALLAAGADPVAFDYIEYSGMAGTVLHGHYSYGFARWLVNCFADAVEIDWERFETPERLALVLPRLVPLMYEDTLVEANIPYREWVQAAKPEAMTDLAWLVAQFEQSDLSERDKSAAYDALELWIRWRLDNSAASRTHNRRLPKRVFYHTEPLIRRNEVSLEQIIRAPLKLRRLSRRAGERVINHCRETTGVRYRELYGIAYGDPASVVRADVGRGLELFLWGLPAERRLPLRAYTAGFTLKNGVPNNYIEGITVCERMELGFNLFYTYREGESAWVYAQVLRMLHALTGAICFSIDPYQIGHHNDEALESGAFWFYRKLGFRPTRPDLIELAAREEKRVRASRDYRTPLGALKRLAEAPVIYELPGTSVGDWDDFRVRHLGLRVAERTAAEFAGNARRMRAAAVKRLGRALGISVDGLNEVERRAFADFAVVLALIDGLARWTDAEKRLLVEIIHAKAASEDAQYARQLQQHARLRAALIVLGS